MKPNILSIGLSVALLALIFLQVRSCRQEPVPSQEGQQQASMMKRVTDSVRHLQALEDSLVIRKKDRAIDSLIPLANMAKQKLNDKGKEVAGTIADIHAAQEVRDTAKLLSNCDSLVTEVEIAGRLLGGYEYLNDSLVTMLQEQRHVQDSLEAVYHLWQELLTKALDSSDINVLHLDKKNTQLQAKANKRWGVGPGVGLGLINGQVKPTVTLSIHYDVFKF